MRKSKRQNLKAPVPLREVLAKALESPQTDAKVALSHLQYRWSEMVGPLLNRKCLPVRISGRRLVIGVAGSAWANELEYLKEELTAKIRQALPSLSIEEIRFEVRKL